MGEAVIRKILLTLAFLLLSPAVFAFSIEGTQNAAWSSGTTIALPAITTTGSGEPIVVVVMQNAGAISSVTSAHLTFTQRASAGAGGPQEWVATASGPLTSESITVNFSSAPTFGNATAFGILGTPSSSYYDTNAALPVQNTTAADPTFSTTAANTIVIAILRFSVTSAPTPGTGWTAISNVSGQYFMVEYHVFTSAQPGTTAAVGTGTGDENGSVVDAYVQGTAPTTSKSQGFF